jgi:DNA helicase II / ATP-dependent DNA helicase PcrA
MKLPTLEQLAVIEAARSSRDNLLVSALAGAAKTSTLCMVAEAMPSSSILCLAFNKRIAEEMQSRLPSNCEARTLNALGHRAWSDTIGRRCSVDAGKNYKLLKAEIDGLSKPEQSEAYKQMAETLDLIAQAKTSGFVPKNFDAKPLVYEDNLWDILDPEPTELQRALILRVMARSIKRAFEGELDFDDQILMPTCFSATFPMFPVVLIDEAQDLSELNHAMLRKIARKRLIGVGDKCQSIYAFRGAHEESMALLQDSFSMKELTLSTTFRCPRSVVREAQWRAPHMRWPDWAEEGSVSEILTWTSSSIQDTSAVLCRNNAPLFAMAIKFLSGGRNVKLVGVNDVGKGLVRVLKKFGDFKLPRQQVLRQIESWKVEQEKKSRSSHVVEDKAQCLHIFAEHGSNLGEAIAYAEHLFAQTGRVNFMTVHKSKGLEFDHVYLLDRGLIRRGQQQEDNLLYVAQTRAKKSLTYVGSEGLQ